MRYFVQEQAAGFQHMKEREMNVRCETTSFKKLGECDVFVLIHITNKYATIYFSKMLS